MCLRIYLGAGVSVCRMCSPLPTEASIAAPVSVWGVVDVLCMGLFGCVCVCARVGVLNKVYPASNLKKKLVGRSCCMH